jgi:hypothetical protein
MPLGAFSSLSFSQQLCRLFYIHTSEITKQFMTQEYFSLSLSFSFFGKRYAHTSTCHFSTGIKLCVGKQVQRLQMEKAKEKVQFTAAAAISPSPTQRA